MSELVEFLRARLDEEAAEAAKLADLDDYPLDPWALQWEETGEWNSYAYLRISKARVLADVEAKRQIVVAFEAAHSEPVGNAVGVDAQDGLISGLTEAVKHLATVYAEHPDFRAEWRP